MFRVSTGFISLMTDILSLFCENCYELLSFIRELLTYLLTYLLTPWCRVLLEKLTGLQLVKKFSAFYGTRSFITAFKRPATYPYPEPARPSPHFPSQFLKINLNIILPSAPGSSKWSLSLMFPPPKPCIYFCSLPYVLHVPSISSFSI